MPLSTSKDCPHCRTNNAGFTYLAHKQNPAKSDIAVVFYCNNCFDLIVIPITSVNQSWLKTEGNFEDTMSSHGGRRRGDMYPQRVSAPIPAHLSEPVQRAFTQATFNQAHRQADAAASMYRKAIDVVTRELDEAFAGKPLQKRIDSLADSGRITQDLKNYAHIVRIDGNRGAHDDEALSRAELEELGRFTELFLTYVVSMPTAVNLRKAAAEAAAATRTS